MGKKQFIFFMAAVCVLLSCEKNMTDTGGVPMPCDGSISISFNTGATKAGAELTEEEKAAGLADGSLFTDLWLWIVHDSSNELRYFAHITDAIDAVDHYEYRFDRVERGDYTLYAVANYSNKLDRFNPYIPEYTYTDQSGKDVTNPKLPWKDAINAEFTKFTLAEIEDDPDDGLDGRVPPTVKKNDGKMPLSIIRKFSVAAGDNYIQAAMTRVCGRLSITVRNLSPDYKIAISNLELSERNPISAYLFQDNHKVPAINPFFDRFVKFRKDEGKDYAMIQPMQESEILSQLMYETGQGISIGLEIDGAVFGTNENGDILDADGLPVEPKVTEIEINEDYYKISEPASSNLSAGLYMIAPIGSPASKLSAETDLSVSLSDIVEESDGTALVSKNKNLVWRWSNNSLTNQDVDRALNMENDISLTTNTQSLVVNISGNGNGRTIRTSNTHWSGLTRYYYYLKKNSADVVSDEVSRNTTVNDDSYRWVFYPVVEESRTVTKTVITNGIKNFNHSGNVQVLNEYGASVPLTHICRNQDVRIILNVSYNPVSGTFDYVIEPWEERNMGAEFD